MNLIASSDLGRRLHLNLFGVLFQPGLVSQRRRAEGVPYAPKSHVVKHDLRLDGVPVLVESF